MIRVLFRSQLAVLLHPDKQNRVPANADSGQPLNGSEAAEAFRGAATPSEPLPIGFTLVRCIGVLLRIRVSPSVAAVNEAVGALLKRGKVRRYA